MPRVDEFAAAGAETAEASLFPSACNHGKLEREIKTRPAIGKYSATVILVM